MHKFSVMVVITILLSSFVFRKSTSLYNRRHTKIVTTVTSLFTSCYVFHWQSHFPDTPLRYPPSFDGRIVLYPTEREVRDYLSWRQADSMLSPLYVIVILIRFANIYHIAHINNLYNTAFWALVQQGGETTTQAHATLRVRGYRLSRRL
jgi:tRNA(His) guanylyltransferase